MLLILLILLFLFGVDVYVFRKFSAVFQKTGRSWWFPPCYWLFSVGILVLFSIRHNYANVLFSERVKLLVGAILVAVCLGKLFFVAFLLLDDGMRLARQIFRKKGFLKKHLSLPPQQAKSLPGKPISRAEFLTKSGMVVASVPLVGISYGILSGAHDYTVFRKTVRLPDLPAAFHGIRIAQISDIHAGSFFRKKAVVGGVELLLKQKPDLIFFTGDLVNNRAKEVSRYLDIFSKLKAPLGTYSVLGNHDYGEYVRWHSPEARQKNLNDLKHAHRTMGWQLLINQHRMIEIGGEKMAVLGIENWSKMKRFPRYGKMALAHKNTDEAAVKLLLSHDPSHWDAQVRPHFKDINLMFSGHTHGMQCGIEIPGIKWSPAQYIFDQWAGLYHKKGQYLYVNRGFGYLDFPGRVGMPPEITIIELQKATS